MKTLVLSVIFLIIGNILAIAQDGIKFYGKPLRTTALEEFYEEVKGTGYELMVEEDDVTFYAKKDGGTNTSVMFVKDGGHAKSILFTTEGLGKDETLSIYALLLKNHMLEYPNGKFEMSFDKKDNLQSIFKVGTEYLLLELSLGLNGNAVSELYALEDKMQ